MNPKLGRLREILGGLENALIAYSGGLDSFFLAKVAKDVLGERVIALTAVSPSYPTYELDETKRLAKFLSIRHEIVSSHELDRDGYRANRGDRCYFCKTELYEMCRRWAEEQGIKWILNGVNVDDLGDYRPGLKAADEWNVLSPLVQAGLTKAEIREIVREMGLPIWEKPALACLSSRFPHGTEVTPERLGRIDRVETELIRLGFVGVRVRFHEPIARIEVRKQDVERFLQPEIREKISTVCRENGFHYATLDLDGYRMGNLNQLLPTLKQ